MELIVHLWTGTPEVGLWCPKCNLPSGIAVPMYFVSVQGVSRLEKPYRRCRDCGANL